MDSARHVKGCHVTRGTTVQSAMDELATTVLATSQDAMSIYKRGFKVGWMTWRALSMSP